MKQRIRLTESQLHNVIKESVKRIIKEIADDTISAAGGEAARAAAHDGGSFGDKVMRKVKGQRPKSKSDYAAQAARLRQGASERANAKDDAHDKAVGNGKYYNVNDAVPGNKQSTHMNKHSVNVAYNNARQGRSTKILPQFGKQDK